MLNSFIKNFNNSIDALPLISSLQPSSNPKLQADNNIDIQKLVQAVIRQLSKSLSEKLGEPVDEKQFKDLADDLLRSKSMEANLLETKEKYNELVSKSSNLFQSARKISNSIGEFVTSINLFLESEELLVPLKQIQKGVNQLQADRVEKQMNYLIKIFENNFQETIDRRIRNAQGSLHEQIKLLKNLNKNLQNEILSFKNSKNNEESKYFESTMKMNTLNDKIAKLTAQKSQLERALKGQGFNLGEKQKALEERDRQLTKMKSRQQQLMEKIRSYQLRINRSQRSIKEVNNESEALNSIIDKLKQKQEQLVEQFEIEARKKQTQHQNSRKKLQNQKFALQQRVELLCEKNTALEASLLSKKQQIQKLQCELRAMKQQGLIEIDINTQQQAKAEGENPLQNEAQGQKKQKISLKELMNRVNSSQARIQQLQNKLQKQTDVNVNKEVLKNLFLNYDDESKEWTVRRNIKYQIYSLLGLNDKLPKPQQSKSTSKWFGIF